MLVATYARGTCLNCQNIIEFQKTLDLTYKSFDAPSHFQITGCPFKISEIFSLGHTKRAYYLSRKYNIRHTIIDNPPAESDPNFNKLRWNYDRKLAGILKRRAIDFIFFGGTGQSISVPFIRTFKNRILGVNIGDLRQTDSSGMPLFFGQKGVLKTILAGREELAVSIFLLSIPRQLSRIVKVSRIFPLLDLDRVEIHNFKKNRNLNVDKLEELVSEIISKREKYPVLFQVVHKNIENAIRKYTHYTLAETILYISLGRPLAGEN
jgi:hypothetical protein